MYLFVWVAFILLEHNLHVRLVCHCQARVTVSLGLGLDLESFFFLLIQHMIIDNLSAPPILLTPRDKLGHCSR